MHRSLIDDRGLLAHEVTDRRPEGVRRIKPREVPAPSITASRPTPGARPSMISCAAATGVIGSSVPTTTRVGAASPSGGRPTGPGFASAPSPGRSPMRCGRGAPPRRASGSSGRTSRRSAPIPHPRPCRRCSPAGRARRRHRRRPAARHRPGDRDRSGPSSRPGRGRRPVGVSDPVREGDEPAHRMAQDDRPRDPERVAERADIVGAHLEGPVRGIVAARPTVVAQVEVDDLGELGQPRRVRLEVGVVVAARPAVETDDGRPLAHPRAVGDERRPLDIEPEVRPVDRDPHADILHPGHPPVVSATIRGRSSMDVGRDDPPR